jgi:hypothetical protein
VTSRVLRYEIPVDGDWHTIDIPRTVLHVAARNINTVELWALDIGGPSIARTFSVFGTGWEVPEHAVHIGTAVVPDGTLSWHLFEDRGGQ